MVISNRRGRANTPNDLNSSADAETRRARIAEITAQVKAAADGAQAAALPPKVSPEPVDERAIARKYGIRELNYPDTEQIKSLVGYLDQAVGTGRGGLVPKTAVLVVQTFLQGTLTRQNITKAPSMKAEEYDALQAPYYIAARIMAKINREKKEQAGKTGGLYSETYFSLNQFIDLLAILLDPGCPWLHSKTLPENVRELMRSLRDFLLLYPEMRRKGRAF